ncbi:MAG: type I-C CRISPR-associated protein Cas8c/Csd1 [Clostridia bacterium]
MLNTENRDVAYNCGRLCGIIRETELEASNTSRVEQSLHLLSRTPGLYIPRFIAYNFINSLEMLTKARKDYYDGLLGEIINNMDCFPSHLRPEDQGIFFLGYYQQMKVMRNKK